MVRIDSPDVQSPDDLSGYDKIAPGRYHVVVRHIDDTFTKSKGALVVKLEILAGTTDGQIGKTFLEFVGCDKKVAKRALAFTLATGLISPSDLGKPLNIDVQPAVGRDLVVDLDTNEYVNKSGETIRNVEVTFLGFHKIGSPAAAGVPLDNRPAQPAAPQSAAPQPPPAPASDDADDGEWSDF